MSEEEKQIHLYMHSKNELGLATLCVEKDKEIERLNKEVGILRHNSQYLVKQKDELEELINKAIEYINTMPLTKGTEWYRIQLLDILTGDDKE